MVYKMYQIKIGFSKVKDDIYLKNGSGNMYDIRIHRISV